MGRIFKFLLIIFVILYGAYYWTVPALVKLPESLNYEGYKLKFEKPVFKTGLIPSIWLSAQKISLLNDDGSEAFKINNPKINIRLLPVVFKKIDIHHLSANGGKAELFIDKENKLKIGQYYLEPPKEQLPFKLHCNDAELGKFAVSINNKVNLDSDIKTIKNGIEIKNLKLSGKNINILANGKITHLNAKIPHLDMKIGVNNTKAEDILPLIPDIENLSPDMDLLLLKKTGFWGDASANLEVKGKADYPNVYGNVIVSNAYMVKEIPNAKKADINLFFKGDKFDLDVKVPTSKTQTVWVKGPINLDKERSADLYITSTDSVDLKTAQTVLNPLHDILHFDLGPVPIMDIKGKGGINLHVSGTRKNPHGWGQFHFKETTASFLDIHNMAINNGTGTLEFNDQNTLFQTKYALLNGKPVTIKGTCSLLGDLNFDVSANDQNIEKLLYTVKTSPMLSDIQKLLQPIEKISGNGNFKLNLYGQVKDINDVVFNKNIFAKGSIELFSNFIKLQNAPVVKTSGIINFDNLNADFNLLSAINNSKIKINGKIKDNNCDANIVSNSFNIGDAIKALSIKVPYASDLSTINTSFTAKYNGKFDNIELDKLWLKGKIYSNKGAKSAITINSSSYEIKNSTFKLPQINAGFGKMLLFADGKITNIHKNPNLNLYINAKPTEDFFDQFFNEKSIYPIKLKGDINLTSKLSGPLNSINAKSTLNIAADSNLYYMGAAIGDVENPVKITLDSIYSPNKIKINNLQYDKIILSQNNKPFTNTQLTAGGTLQLLDNNIVKFNNFKIKTQTPTDAKIFNIIFRKPLMKQGVFTSDLILNGTSQIPIVFGKLNITSIDIPFVDSTIRDINLDFKPDKIYIISKGTVLTNPIQINAIMKNKLIPPYIIENLNLKLADLNINKITETLRDLEADAARTPFAGNNTQNFDTSQIIINNAKVIADKIKVRNINADNFRADLKLDNKMQLNVDNFKFNIAQGEVSGNLKQNLLTNNINLDIHLTNANALIMSEALFDLKGQVYGLVNGDFSLACNGKTQEDCFKTLSGNGNFKIADGRMPKLGSLEYLLKAGNIFKGGITGLSINSIIDLITPLKTGNFDSISGVIHLVDGTADKIEIFSSGQDLNMYMTGSYNIVTSIADMEILGSLSKNITTIFGKIKNASLNTLFNTIPGINDSTEKLLMQEDIAKIPNIKDVTDIYRIFAVDINGDINGNDYVKSFKWVK